MEHNHINNQKKAKEAIYDLLKMVPDSQILRDSFVDLEQKY